MSIISLSLFSPSHSTSLTFSAVSREKVHLPMKSRHQGGCCFDIKRPSGTKLSTPAMWFTGRERKTRPADKWLQHKKPAVVQFEDVNTVDYAIADEKYVKCHSEKLNLYHAVMGEFQCHCKDATSVCLHLLYWWCREAKGLPQKPWTHQNEHVTFNFTRHFIQVESNKLK